MKKLDSNGLESNPCLKLTSDDVIVLSVEHIMKSSFDIF